MVAHHSNHQPVKKGNQNPAKKGNQNPASRLCSQYEETIDHRVSGFPVLAKTAYIQRHEKQQSSYNGIYARTKSIIPLHPKFVINISQTF